MRSASTWFVGALMALAACNGPDEWSATSRPIKNADALRGCTFTELKTPGTLPNLYVVRCPLSDTTTTWTEGSGKQQITRHVATVEGTADGGAMVAR